MQIKLHFIEQGEGFPMLLLHGNGENCGYFKHQMDFFGQHYHVMAIDTRGHGESPRGDKEFTIKQFAEDLHGFMDQQRMDQAVILGFSDGGNIALTFAMKYPERVKKLILNGANLFPKGVKAFYQWPVELGYRITRWFAKKSEDALRKNEMLGLMVNEPHIDPSELSKLDIPVLVVAGTHDMIKEDHTRLIYKSLPNARMEILEGDHFVAEKHPEVFNAAVMAFLNSRL